MRWRLLIGVVLVSLACAPMASAQQQPPTRGFALTPDSGPPGTRVHFEGDVPTDASDFETYRNPAAAYGMQGGFADCELILPVLDVSSTVSDTGHVSGSFTVGRVGGCFMSDTDRGPQQARAGVYTVMLTCHGCTPIGTFTITADSLVRTGFNSGVLLATAASLIASGALLLLLTSRRRSSSCS
jgi:hypothetical protein